MINHAQVAITAGLLLVLSSSFVEPLHSHEEGVLNLASPTVAAGATVALSGERFSRTTAYRLVLKGALREYALATVESDDEGGFTLELEIPAVAQPGAYRLVAVAPDGDDVAEVDLEVQAAVRSEADAMEEVGEQLATATLPRADELELERRWTGVEWFLMGVLFGGALAGGLALYRKPGSTA